MSPVNFPPPPSYKDARDGVRTAHHKVLWSEEHPDEVCEPVALLVHQARVGVHVNLKHHADADVDADADAYVKADADVGADDDVDAEGQSQPGLGLPQPALQQYSVRPSSSCGCCGGSRSESFS